MSQLGVRIVDVTQITLPQISQTTPPPMRLSFFDSQFLGHPSIQLLMLFANPTTALPFPSLVRFIRSSLAASLPDYLPLAGRLTCEPSTGDVVIDLSDPRVAFVEAESGLDVRRLAANETYDVGSLMKLVPETDGSVLPFPVFAVQMTRFSGGGVAVGCSVHHSIVDGKAMLQFVKTWTDACKAMMSGIETPVKIYKPLYDRAMIKHPKGKEEEIARKFILSLAPDLPNIRSSCLPSMPEDDHIRLTRRTFVLDASSIQRLIKRATRDEARGPSAFLAISTYVWGCLARLRSCKPDEQVFLGLPMDCRARLDPPVDEGYFGNCVRAFSTGILAGDLVGNDGLVNACTAIRKSIEEVARDPLRDCEKWVADIKSVPSDKYMNATASPTFRVYDSDFGWGGPDLFERVSMNRDGEFDLFAGKEEGTVQMSVSLRSDRAETFAELFLGGLRG